MHNHTNSLIFVVVPFLSLVTAGYIDAVGDLISPIGSEVVSGNLQEVERRNEPDASGDSGEIFEDEEEYLTSSIPTRSPVQPLVYANTLYNVTVRFPVTLYELLPVERGAVIEGVTTRVSSIPQFSEILLLATIRGLPRDFEAEANMNVSDDRNRATDTAVTLHIAEPATRAALLIIVADILDQPIRVNMTTGYELVSMNAELQRTIQSTVTANISTTFTSSSISPITEGSTSTIGKTDIIIILLATGIGISFIILVALVVARVRTEFRSSKMLRDVKRNTNASNQVHAFDSSHPVSEQMSTHYYPE